MNVIGVFRGDVTSAAGAQSQRAMVGFDQQPVAVPLAFERPLTRLETCHRTVGGEHGREGVEIEDRLVLHAMRQPLVPVGLNQRVPPRDSTAVQVDNHLPFSEPFLESSRNFSVS